MWICMVVTVEDTKHVRRIELKHGAVAVNQNGRLLGIWAVDFGDFTTTLNDVSMGIL